MALLYRTIKDKADWTRLNNHRVLTGWSHDPEGRKPASEKEADAAGDDIYTTYGWNVEPKVYPVLAHIEASALNAAWKYGVAVGQRRSSLTIEQAASILDRSERGRAVAGELYAFLTGRAMALDMDGKTAVLALIEEAFINRPGSVADALTKFVED